MKVIIAGSRTIGNYKFVDDAIKASGFEITEVVSGGAFGVDVLADWWAEHHKIPRRVFLAEWSKYGKSAGPVRNQQMADYGEALIAVWDGKSRGTKDMIDKAKRKGLLIYVYVPPA